MHVEIGDHALFDELALHKIASEFDALRLAHLTRDGEFHLAGKLRVPADLAGFYGIPECGAVAELLGRTLRQHDLGMDHARLVGEVVMAPEPLVGEPRGRPVGGRRDRARSRRARDHFHREMVDRHAGASGTL
jgi:hypothetical protein